MSEILFNFVFAAMAVAGFAVIWRNWVEDHPRWEAGIKRVLGGAHKVLTCGPCFTYWLALAYTGLMRPLWVWMPFNSSFLNGSPLGLIGNILAEWMALAWLAVFLRFAYVALQSYVRKNADA